MSSPIILSRTPFRIPLGGGSTDMPSYYQQHGGFVFGATINMYMDVLIKRPRSDDYIHVHYKEFEVVDDVDNVKHAIAREALRMSDINSAVAISFKADTPAGTGLGSSGACAVALLKGLATFKRGGNLDNVKAAAMAFELTQRLGLPDGKQDPYVCAEGGFVVLTINTDGSIQVFHPDIASDTIRQFLANSLFFFTGIRRDSKPILAAQNSQKVMALKHRTKKIGQEILQCFLRNDLDSYGRLLDEHWYIKKEMAGGISNNWLDEIYEMTRRAGALGGKILGAGGGGYFMFYCQNEDVKTRVRDVLRPHKMREMEFAIDYRGARTKLIDL